MNYTKEDKLKFLNMTLDEKVKRTKQLIMEWYGQFDGKVYVSFSGGKDSTVLLHIARQLFPDIPGVFDDTGLEYPEIRDFVKKQENIIWLKPKKTFLQVIREYGWPIISKEQSRYISDLRNPNCCGATKYCRLNGGTSGAFRVSNKWIHLLSSKFKIANNCCDVMKKSPFKKFDKETGRKAMIATMAGESNLRFQKYMQGDCNEYSAKHPISKPMSFWSEDDVLHYIERERLEIAEIYGEVKDGKNTGVHRTGCMFCMYGLHLEEKGNTRFDQMKETHPKLYDYIMNKLGGKEVVEAYLGAENDLKCVKNAENRSKNAENDLKCVKNAENDLKCVKNAENILLLCDYRHSELFNSYLRDFNALKLKTLMCVDDAGHFALFNGSELVSCMIGIEAVGEVIRKAETEGGIVIREV